MIFTRIFIPSNSFQILEDVLFEKHGFHFSFSCDITKPTSSNSDQEAYGFLSRKSGIDFDLLPGKNNLQKLSILFAVDHTKFEAYMYIYIYTYRHTYFIAFIIIGRPGASYQFLAMFPFICAFRIISFRWSPDIVGLGELAKALEVELESLFFLYFFWPQHVFRPLKSIGLVKLNHFLYKVCFWTGEVFYTCLH